MITKDIVLIAFIIMFALSSALLATGAIPRVIDLADVANQTKYESINQTAILQDFVTLYLANTKNDTREALQALASAKESIVNQEQSLENQGRILSENRNITQDILEISKEHKQVAHDHDALAKKGDDLIEKIDNVTQLSYELLAQHAQNVTEATIKAEEAVNKSGN